ncbi:MAG: biotin--[Clostridia bacterium]|nr:biotin--[acetyl-CoA-carboxylase] ligase [Clostridia bacterium]
MQHAILSALPPVARIGQRISYLPTCSSTNDLLKAMAEEGAPEGTVLVAGEQTRGKGRLGRSFTSAAGKGIYLSALLRPDLPPTALLPLMGFTAEAMVRAVEAATGAEARIKWVNDLVLNGRKICGILTESAFSAGGRLRYVVVGVGLNVNYDLTDFPPELQTMAGSLKTELGRAFDLAPLTAAMIGALDDLYAALLSGDTEPYLAAYRAHCLTLHKDVLLLQNGVSTPAHALDVDEALGLRVRYPDGREALVRSGEASVRGLTGYAD